MDKKRGYENRIKQDDVYDIPSRGPGDIKGARGYRGGDERAAAIEMMKRRKKYFNILVVETNEPR